MREIVVVVVEKVKARSIIAVQRFSGVQVQGIKSQDMKRGKAIQSIQLPSPHLQKTPTSILFSAKMKSMLTALFSLFAAASASHLLAPAHLHAAPVLAPTTAIVAQPWAANVATHRFTRNDWIQPGLAYNIPAVAKYHSITPGFTTLHQTSVPVVAQAPIVAPVAPVVHSHLLAAPAAPLLAPAHFHGHYGAPLLAPWRR